MKKSLSLSCLLVLSTLTLSGAAGLDDLTDFVNRVNARAVADIGAFTRHVSSVFKVPVPRVEDVLKVVTNPADAYMTFKVAEVTARPPEVVVKEYQANKDKGWGVIAKNLGIKPGSPEFHALKKGGFDADEGGSSASGHGGSGKGKGKGKGKK